MTVVIFWAIFAKFFSKTMNDTPIPFFFIIGRPRTGTTLLRSLFDAHPNVQIPWECQFILNLQPAYGHITSWTKKDLHKFYNDLLLQWQFSAWNIDHEELKLKLFACEGNYSYTDICRVIYLSNRSFYPKNDIQLIGDKNHGYTIYVDRLKQLFPDAKFIYILRDYRDNFHSIKNVDFEIPIVSLVVYKWKYFYKQAIAWSKKYPDSMYFIRYEDLATDPELHFRKMCEFLNLEYKPEVFEFYKMGDKAKELYPDDVLSKHHKSLFNPINTSRLGLWEKSMTATQIRIADQVAGIYATEAGYQPRYHDYSIRIAIQALPGIVYARAIYFMTGVIDKFPYRIREKLLSKGPLLLAKLFSGFFHKKA